MREYQCWRDASFFLRVYSVMRICTRGSSFVVTLPWVEFDVERGEVVASSRFFWSWSILRRILATPMYFFLVATGVTAGASGAASVLGTGSSVLSAFSSNATSAFSASDAAGSSAAAFFLNRRFLICCIRRLPADCFFGASSTTAPPSAVTTPSSFASSESAALDSSATGSDRPPTAERRSLDFFIMRALRAAARRLARDCGSAGVVAAAVSSCTRWS
mmetsp:Transcript_8003/g.10032  ORF Transcript_8003/g.10032 Transcript_8003/m.10032 type:complete len:218 (-) Transcript_8003:133-786(-)